MANRKERKNTLANLLSEEINSAVMKAVTKASLQTRQDTKELIDAIRNLTRVMNEFSRQAQQIKTKFAERKNMGTLAKSSVLERKQAYDRSNLALVTKNNKQVRICSIKGCGRKHYARGMCKKHYYADSRRKKLAALAAGLPIPVKPARKKKPRPRVCSIKECEEKHYAKGLCKRHYMAKFFRMRKKTQKK